MTKNKEEQMVIPRITLNAADSAKAAYLMERHFLTINEMIKALIRKEYVALMQAEEENTTTKY